MCKVKSIVLLLFAINIDICVMCLFCVFPYDFNMFFKSIWIEASAKCLNLNLYFILLECS